ncbi:MAG: nitroreductase family protein [Lachnospiraceae bacterium]|nr:nitroreductase family protein [Lachnospiraceae bacterium]
MDVMEVLSTRRTFRAFTKQPVPEDVVADILEAARTANCGANRQSLRYAVARSKEVVDSLCELTKWAAAIPDGAGTPALDQRPTLYIVLLQDTTVGGYSDIDVGIAVASMTTAAWAKGVGSCIIGTLHREKTAELLKLPENLLVHTGIAFGYPAHKSTVVPLKDGKKNYWRDENGDYFVPKYSLEEIVKYY